MLVRNKIKFNLNYIRFFINIYYNLLILIINWKKNSLFIIIKNGYKQENNLLIKKYIQIHYSLNFYSSF